MEYCSDTHPLVYHGAREEGLVEDEREHHEQVPEHEALHSGAQPHCAREAPAAPCVSSASHPVWTMPGECGAAEVGTLS